MIMPQFHEKSHKNRTLPLICAQIVISPPFGRVKSMFLVSYEKKLSIIAISLAVCISNGRGHLLWQSTFG